MMRIGVSRQQYQRLEAKGNPQLDTLELMAKGLNCELMLIPKEKVRDVVSVLEHVDPNPVPAQESITHPVESSKKSLSDDPWQDILENDL